MRVFSKDPNGRRRWRRPATAAALLLLDLGAADVAGRVLLEPPPGRPAPGELSAPLACGASSPASSNGGGAGRAYQVDVTLVNAAAPGDSVVCAIGAAVAAVYEYRAPGAPQLAYTHAIIYPGAVGGRPAGADVARTAAYYGARTDALVFSGRVLGTPAARAAIGRVAWAALLAGHEAAHRCHAVRGDAAAAVEPGPAHEAAPQEAEADREGMAVAAAAAGRAARVTLALPRPEADGRVTRVAPSEADAAGYRAIAARPPRVVVRVRRVRSLATWVRDRVTG